MVFQKKKKKSIQYRNESLAVRENPTGFAAAKSKNVAILVAYITIANCIDLLA